MHIDVYNFYVFVIDNMVKKKTFTWSDIKENIEKTKYRPKNWMDVRVVLQKFINYGIIERDFSDIYVERYSVKN